MSKIDQPKRESKREQIAFGREINWEKEGDLGTIFFGPDTADQFPPIPIGTMETLLKDGYIDPHHRHNNAPSASCLTNWADSIQQRFKSEQLRIGLVGYMVSPFREDSRISLTGVSIRSSGPMPEEIKCEAAREFNPDLIVVDDFDVKFLWD